MVVNVCVCVFVIVCGGCVCGGVSFRFVTCWCGVGLLRVVLCRFLGCAVCGAVCVIWVGLVWLCLFCLCCGVVWFVVVCCSVLFGLEWFICVWVVAFVLLCLCVCLWCVVCHVCDWL